MREAQNEDQVDGSEDTLVASPPAVATRDASALTLESDRLPRTPLALPKHRHPGPSARRRVDDLEPPVADHQKLLWVDPDHYVIEGELACGGMGRIFMARDRRLGRRVAIKQLLVQTPELVRRFEREARITARLQHPSIVNVLEAGVWPGGEPFYAMKLIVGRPLDVVVKERSTLRGRLALLPHVIAVADALAYAHAKRIVHRDLKPSNVLIGDFGETVVIDWGLAKDLSERPPGAASVIGGLRAHAVDETSVGAVIGTPAYMSPEQARGEAADMRADVYAMGGLLYHLLTGAPPYEGASSNEVLDRVVVGGLRPLAQAAPGTPSDLVTIVEKAMQLEPQGRYPSARELAEDLKRFQTGQLVGAHRYTRMQLVRRFLRRHRLPLVVAAVLILNMAVMAGFALRRLFLARDTAERALTVARRQGAAAEHLVEFALVDIRPQIADTERMDSLFRLATEVSKYYEEIDPWITTADGDTLRHRSRAFEIIAEVLEAKGKRVDAIRNCELSLRLREWLVIQIPGESDAWRELARSHVCLARSLLGTDNDGAGRHLDVARQFLEPLATNAADGASAALMGDVFIHLGDLATRRDDFDGAAFYYGRALVTVAARPPGTTDDELRTILTRARSRLGQLRSVRDGRLEPRAPQDRAWTPDGPAGSTP